ncbi:uncharacterized protein BO95DRAFT_230320 [Aspergillus brunneoviolaceus CBS 621.78]|uniref:Uncharacterized protein n=1 Tax=Aspergillus brunneoviolaceus CBS 621.78 TaxID=1450534 RepID=A0ACD1G0J8_9EURO|nr:hypothetical protein BO95DRAFT_230320 [Aspergillus brunneoviolaceus CBS 621.78]RAH42693.1 hypothetical protein BO95DRAFT_230320 [Aspergillus brunneoviolaceus CBS 621.78]
MCGSMGSGRQITHTVVMYCTSSSAQTRATVRPPISRYSTSYMPLLFGSCCWFILPSQATKPQARLPCQSASNTSPSYYFAERRSHRPASAHVTETSWTSDKCGFRAPERSLLGQKKRKEWCRIPGQMRCFPRLRKGNFDGGMSKVTERAGPRLRLGCSQEDFD